MKRLIRQLREIARRLNAEPWQPNPAALALMAELPEDDRTAMLTNSDGTPVRSAEEFVARIDYMQERSRCERHRQTHITPVLHSDLEDMTIAYLYRTLRNTVEMTDRLDLAQLNARLGQLTGHDVAPTPFAPTYKRHGHLVRAYWPDDVALYTLDLDDGTLAPMPLEREQSLESTPCTPGGGSARDGDSLATRRDRRPSR